MLLGWLYLFEAPIECSGVLNFGKRPIKWRQRSDMTIIVDWDVKHKFKQTNPKFIIY